MKRKLSTVLFVLYLAIWGSYCGLEINTFVGDLPFFQMDTLFIFINVVLILLIPPLLYCVFAWVPLKLKKYLMPAVLIFNSVYVHLAILLSIYKADRHMDFDFNYFWYNTSVAWSVLWKLFAPWLVCIFLSLAVFVFLQPLIFDPAARAFKIFTKHSWRGGLALVLAMVAGAFCQYFTIASVRGSATGFVYAGFFSDQRLRNEYRNLYESHFRELQANGIKGAENGDASRLGDMIIMYLPESLNGLFVGADVTPQLLRAAEDGILFTELYGNSIQSERGYECILCGIPPSFTGILVEDYPIEDVEKIGCLPRLFKEMGYQPVVFYNGYLNLRAMKLFEAVGFERILADDIMQQQDEKYAWGYREDIWFTRVNDHIMEHFGTGKYFIFITASATNHTPFKVLDPNFIDRVPYPTPKKFEENLANTTYVQDAYFGHFYDLYRENYSDRATLITVSDHSWPMSIHRHNIFNERGAFEENFRIAMLVIPPSGSSEFAAGTTVAQRFSQMDILPSLLELSNVRQDYRLGESFVPWLLSDPDRACAEPQKLKVSIQPYGGGFIAIHRHPKKYLFDVLGKNVKVYDLYRDPGEESPALYATGQYMSLIHDFFRNDVAITQ